MTELEHVWQPGTIGALQLPHRIVMGSMHLGLERLDDGGHALAAFYRARAAGGAGLIVTGGCAVSRVGAGGASYGVINDDADAATLGAIPEAVHAEGGLVLLQLGDFVGALGTGVILASRIIRSTGSFVSSATAEQLDRVRGHVHGPTPSRRSTYRPRT